MASWSHRFCTSTTRWVLPTLYCCYSEAVLLKTRFLQTDVQLHSFSNGTSTATRKDNWDQVQKVCSLKQVPLPSPLVQGTIKVK